MPKTISEQNKALVLKAFDTLFNQRDYAAAERFWSPDYIQHSAHIEPGREGLFNLIKLLPSTLRYEAGVIVAEGDFVIVHGRFSGFGAPVNWMRQVRRSRSVTKARANSIASTGDSLAGPQCAISRPCERAEGRLKRMLKLPENLFQSHRVECDHHGIPTSPSD